MHRGLRSGGRRGARPEWTEGERTKARHACGCRSEESLYCEGPEIGRRIGGDGGYGRGRRSLAGTEVSDGDGGHGRATAASSADASTSASAMANGIGGRIFRTL